MNENSNNTTTMMKPNHGRHISSILFGVIIFTSAAILNGEGKASRRPKISGTKYVFRGEKFTLKCEYNKTSVDINTTLEWTYPSKTTASRVETRSQWGNDILQSNITIVNATDEDSGIYMCKTSTSRKPSRFTKIVGPVLLLKQSPNMRKVNENGKTVKANVNQSEITLSISMVAYPDATTWFLRDDQNISTSTQSSKYVEGTDLAGDKTLKIKNLTVSDTATYTLVAINTVGTKTFSYNVLVEAPPVLNFDSPTPIRKFINETEKLSCNIMGLPLPNIIWEFVAEDGSRKKIAAKSVRKSLYEEQSSIELLIQESGAIICAKENDMKTVDKVANVKRQIYAYEIKNGFGIKDGVRWYPEGDDVTLECLASKYDYTRVTWKHEKEIVYNSTKLSHVAILKLKNIQQKKSGNYTCVATTLHGENKTDTTSIQVEGKREPVLDKSFETIEASKSQPAELVCIANAVPPPRITWNKEGVIIGNNNTGLEIKETLNHTILTSTIIIRSMKEEDQGKYECEARNRLSYRKKFINLMIPENHLTLYIAIFVVVFFTLMAIVIYLMLKVKKEKQFRKELEAAGLLNFNEGALKSINPELNVDQQAELLPYDDRFEFPVGNLTLGKQLGAGAFGVVYKGEARGIINAEESTTVAVKTVKKSADNVYIKALASELKIMVHMGKHVNIVNLLGACTKNIEKRELMVIVEYCRFGNLHNYLIKHREVYINQLTADSNNEKFGHENRAYTCSIDSGMPSDYGSFNQSQATDHTFLNTASSGRTERKASEGYVLEPEWRTNYESDYQGVAPRPLFSRDLLAWAFQIARGMEYLASRKVLHGDLAARNIVLADDNVVKICDFGLARSIYKNDEYQKKGDSPLPLKWLAVECLTDRIFSTQSDVWSFGIVLWEIFSLAKTPYPGYQSAAPLLKFFLEGNRLEKPKYANDKLYDVMRHCWELKPTQRPSFTKLQEELGNFLAEADRKRYIDLNSSCMEQNAKNADREDLLAMMNSPDYNNLVTPSPFGCGSSPNGLGKTFFPHTPKEDNTGYLQSTTFNGSVTPTSPTQKFKFDSQRNKTPPQLSHRASELIPMLNLDSLPESGSQSDPDDGHPPYLHGPRVEEELDEVFAQINPKDSLENKTGTAITNPTYIALDNFTAPSDKSHNGYVNSIPNVLVK